MESIKVSTPHALTQEEWQEVAEVEEVMGSWGFSEDTTLGEIMNVIHAVRFDFSPQTMPNYRGDLFVLIGDNFTEPLILTRNPDNNNLEAQV